jgi:hypothetical protein
MKCSADFRAEGHAANDAAWYTEGMSKLLDEIVADVRTLPPDEQDQIAEVVMAFRRGREELSAPLC